MIYPSELSDFIYGELGAEYKPNYDKAKNSLDADEEQNLINLGTYFPRSFIEINKIFTDLTQNSRIRESLKRKKEIYILDIGSGTGGSLLGLLWFLKEFNQNNEEISIHILSIDGNRNALKIQKQLFDKFSSKNVTYVQKQSAISDNNLKDVLDQAIETFTQDKFDIIVASKFINELYRKNYDDRRRVYGNITDASSNYLIDDGIFFLSDVTDYIDGGYINGTHISEKIFIPKIMNKETIKYLNRATAKLKPIIPLSCALWYNKCKTCFCFTQNVIKLEFSRDSKRKYGWKNGLKDEPCKVTYKIFAHTAFAESILSEIIEKPHYRIAKDRICRLGEYSYPDPLANTYMDAFSLTPKK